MLKYIDTTVFNAGTQTIVNTVNCVGVMGAGLALEFQLRFSEMERDYVERCKRKQVNVGRPYLYKEYGNPLILNFPTKNHWRYPSQIDWIKKGLEYFVSNYKRGGITSIAFPKLGCDKGGLDWKEVSFLIEEYLKELDIDIYICLDRETKASGIEGIMVDLVNNSSDWSWGSKLSVRDIRSKIANFLPIKRFRELRQLEGVGKQTYNEAFKILYKAALQSTSANTKNINLIETVTPISLISETKSSIEQFELDKELKVVENIHLEASNSKDTSEIEDTLPKSWDAFNIMLPYIEQVLNKERTKEELAQMFGLPKSVVGDWLLRAEELGKVKKLLRPVRYISTSTLPHQQLKLEFAK